MTITPCTLVVYFTYILCGYCVLADASSFHKYMLFYLFVFLRHLHLYVTNPALWLQETNNTCLLTYLNIVITL